MLSTAAFNALLKILEEPPAHLMFILATTELHKVPATIKSRCQQFSFQRILPGDIAQRLLYVAEREGIALTSEGAALLSRLADGGLRDALSLLDQCAGPAGPIGEQQVLDALGLAGNLETARLMGRVADRDAGGALEDIARLYGGGKDISAILGELASLTRDLLIRKTAPRSGGTLLNGGFDETTMRGLSEKFTAPRLVWMLTVLQAALAELPRSSNRRTDAELCLIRLCDERLDDSAGGLVARLDRVEAQLSSGVPLLKEKSENACQIISGEKAGISISQSYMQGETLVDDDRSQKDLLPWEAAGIPRVEPMAAASDPKPTADTVPSVPPAPDGDIWPALAAGLKNKVSRNAWSFLGNPSMVRGEYADGVLTLWADDELVKGVVSRPTVLEAVGTLAQGRLGREVRVSVKVGRPESAVGHDKLDDLLAFGRRFDNITIKE